MNRRGFIIVVVTAVIAISGPLPAQNITFDRILNSSKEPQNWLTYSGAVNGQRHSALTQITPANVKNLELQWVWQAKSLEKFETTALVVDGVLYTVEAPDTVVALDAVTRLFWTFPYTNAQGANPCCGRVNRGLAILGNTLFLGTLDAHLIALDTTTGKPVWNTSIPIPAEGDKNRYGVTHAPLVVKDKVIIGTTGGDGPMRGFIDAYDTKTGKQVWRFYTIPARRTGNETWPAEIDGKQAAAPFGIPALRSGNKPDLLGGWQSERLA
jgi:alcohol dehydrogenase (cytochrome c)